MEWNFSLLELVDPIPNAPLGWAYLPTVRTLDVVQGTSQVRKIVHDFVTNNGIRRPPANVLRRWRELTEIGRIDVAYKL